MKGDVNVKEMTNQSISDIKRSMSDQDVRRLEQARYLLKLLGRRRDPIVRETSVDDHQYQDMLMLSENYKKHCVAWFSDADKATVTVKDQVKVEAVCHALYASIIEDEDEDEELPFLQRQNHVQYVTRELKRSLGIPLDLADATQTWQLYGSFNSLLMLGESAGINVRQNVAAKVLAFVDKPNGGIGGGSGHMGHIASTYAGLAAFSLTEDTESWARIDRGAIYNWIMTALKQPDGSFATHRGGELDTRAVYCALTVASMLDIVSPELVKGTAEWIAKCQTYEGGFAGTPGSEAHGGYTFCAVAALCLLGDPATMLTSHANLSKLIDWSTNLQMEAEGGFCGRSNKLVDGCYSHWVGGVFPFLEMAVAGQNPQNSPLSLFSRNSLQNYILACCQDSDLSLGGLRDKPGAKPDYYHTNYVLLGLSHCQHHYTFDYHKYNSLKEHSIDAAAYCITAHPLTDSNLVEYKTENKIESVSPLFGTILGLVERMRQFYCQNEHCGF